jgi:hypothetical protein
MDISSEGKKVRTEVISTKQEMLLRLKSKIHSKRICQRYLKAEYHKVKSF